MDPWQQLALFRTAPERFTLTVTYDRNDGPWIVTASIGRRSPAGEMGWHSERYERLTPEEALDVVCALAASGLDVQV